MKQPKDMSIYELTKFSVEALRWARAKAEMAEDAAQGEERKQRMQQHIAIFDFLIEVKLLTHTSEVQETFAEEAGKQAQLLHIILRRPIYITDTKAMVASAGTFDSTDEIMGETWINFIQNEQLNRWYDRDFIIQRIRNKQGETLGTIVITDAPALDISPLILSASILGKSLPF